MDEKILPGGRERGLKPRLARVADGLARGGYREIIYDIGTDHALLPIYLIINGMCGTAVATDISGKSVARAERNASAAGVTDRMRLYAGDGFGAIPDYKPDNYVIIAGIGAKNITEILERGGGAPRAAALLALQPMNGQEVLREWLFLNAYDILYELLAREGNRVYSLIFCSGADAAKPYSYPEIFMGRNVEYTDRGEYLRFLRFTRLKIMNRYNGLKSENTRKARAGEPAENALSGDISGGPDDARRMETRRLKEVLDEIETRIAEVKCLLE